MRPISSRLATFSNALFLSLGSVMCAPGSPAISDDDDSQNDDGRGGSTASGGAAASGGNLNDDIITVEPTPPKNPCEGEDAPEECVLVAPPACGDGLINLDPPEACDDGNSRPGDGCSGACTIEPYFTCPIAGQPCQTTITCGDGVLEPGEACDDGNTHDGDGCSSTCKQIELGFSCRQAGQDCVRVFMCGDGVVDPNEGCDAGADSSVEGCDARCRIQLGYKCEGTPSNCAETVCGDGMVEGAESCDDGNVIPFDGCSPVCQAEPTCETGKPCTSACGDGIKLNDEECDDGNLRNGDGCSSTCQQEVGFKCSQPEACQGDDCTLDLDIIYRDFSDKHSDFGVGCATIQRDVVKPLLNASGKPELAASSFPDACVGTAASFAEWYDEAPTNHEILGNIVLFDNGKGGYVNRLNNQGDQYELLPPDGIQWCSNSPDDCDACPAGYTTCYAPCTPWGNNSTQTCAVYAPEEGPITIDGNPMFFPIEETWGSSADLGVAAIPEEVYGGGWQEDPSGTLRNFYFTSEIAYWFEYTAGMSAELSFVGDDDVWVFINGRLAVDLGGLHVPVEGKFSLQEDGRIELLHGVDGSTDDNEPESATVADFGLAPGNVYEVKVFQAERKKVGSSYRLTLSGFNAGVSDCVTDCGDGEVGPGEECDDGPAGNTGGYNECKADCTMGPHCGDGIQQPSEDCDYGSAMNTGQYGGCSAVCQLGPHCGDGVVTDGEECDDGVNDGGYGECAPGCVLGPVCGDGGLEPAFEECDDGNNRNQDGCSGACKVEVVQVR